jgi:hypothetical protein
VPATIRRRACSIVGISLFFAFSVATAAPALATSDTTTKTSSPTRVEPKAEASSTPTAKAGSAPKVSAEKKARLDFQQRRAQADSKIRVKAGRSYAVTWHSNESNEERAIYHCVRGGEIYGRAFIVDRNDATRFTCSYDKDTDWPYGVKVYQPPDRRVVVKVGLLVVQDYDPRSSGRDVWVVKGNPTGWWRTFIK